MSARMRFTLATCQKVMWQTSRTHRAPSRNRTWTPFKQNACCLWAARGIGVLSVYGPPRRRLYGRLPGYHSGGSSYRAIPLARLPDARVADLCGAHVKASTPFVPLMPTELNFRPTTTGGSRKPSNRAPTELCSCGVAGGELGEASPATGSLYLTASLGCQAGPEIL